MFASQQKARGKGKSITLPAIGAPTADHSLLLDYSCTCIAPEAAGVLASGSAPRDRSRLIFLLWRAGAVEDRWMNRRRVGSRRRCGGWWSRRRSCGTRPPPSSPRRQERSSLSGNGRWPLTLPSAACGPRSIPSLNRSYWFRSMPTRQAAPVSTDSSFFFNWAILFCRLYKRSHLRICPRNSCRSLKQKTDGVDSRSITDEH